ncbi:hypothetical protein O3G_MSEX001503 [Manduca sexta]|uniref:WW domain-containing protein n=1 Tax=Manduca sexta TaxID=7130 RepID=A0A921YKB9_MANSE|nr:hypothetical protein O3G_MSEX001503 [Manduca sexta]
MNKLNPLAGLVGYGDSDDDSDDGAPSSVRMPNANMAVAHGAYPELPLHPPGVHPAPISHCPWSACYDESSGFTYYWNQLTNAVTWEAPPEYLLALKLAQQQLHAQGTSEVSAEEWQLYQQVLAEKQGTQGKVPVKPGAKVKTTQKSPAEKTNDKKRKLSEVEEEKIELITSYHNSDSESNDEPDSPVKTAPPPPAKVSKTAKKPKSKPVMQYGPALPPDQNYTTPIGPEMPQELHEVKEKSPLPPESKTENAVPKLEENSSTIIVDNEDSQDESALLTKLKDKAQLLERLGGEIPSELHKIIYDDYQSSNKSKESLDAIDNIDDLLNEIEKKELPKIKAKKSDKYIDVDAKSPKSREVTSPTEAKPLFPSVQNISEVNIPHVNDDDQKSTDKSEIINVSEKKGANLYLMNTDVTMENTQRKKLRISNSVLPERKRNESPVYTTKYAQSIDGFTSERTGLGFNKEDQDDESPNNTTSHGNTISYGNGLTFTKGETLNEEKRDEDLDDLTELVEAKLKYLNQLQPCILTPVQEMLIQMQVIFVLYNYSV